MCSFIYNFFLCITEKYFFFLNINNKEQDQADIISIDEEWENILREEL